MRKARWGISPNRLGQLTRKSRPYVAPFTLEVFNRLKIPFFWMPFPVAQILLENNRKSEPQRFERQFRKIETSLRVRAKTAEMQGITNFQHCDFD